MKKCFKCKAEKDFSQFNKLAKASDGLQCYCKTCQKILSNEWEKNNSKYRSEYYKNYEFTHANERKMYRFENREERRKYEKNLRETNLNHKISCNLRRRLNKFISGELKNGSAIKDLGCSIDELKNWLSRQFIEDMNWENYGIVWNIDHIIPLSKVDLTDTMQLKKVCHWFNLRPLFVRDNIVRGNRI